MLINVQITEMDKKKESEIWINLDIKLNNKMILIHDKLHCSYEETFRTGQSLLSSDSVRKADSGDVWKIPKGLVRLGLLSNFLGILLEF